MSGPQYPPSAYLQAIELLGLVEERVTAHLQKGGPIDAAALAASIIDDRSDKGMSWQELLEIIRLIANDTDGPTASSDTRH